MEEIDRIAQEHALAIVEDAAHALPAAVAGRTIGDPDAPAGVVRATAFSFYATKNLTTAEGGMVVARDPAHHARVRALRAHAVERPAGGSATYDVTALGLNYRPSEITSALGRVQLGRQAEDRRRREAVRAAYERELTGVHVPFRGSAAPSAHHLMAVVLPASTDRAAVQAALADDGVQTSVHYPPAHLLSYYRERFGCREGSLPVTEDFTARELSLPMHARMSDEDVAYVASALRSHLDAAVGSTA
jgi:dTDP-4-amino-4,6-dideoxygalactose transaminase